MEENRTDEGTHQRIQPLSLERIEFGAGESPGLAGLEVEPGVMTVLVGPNSSGKSLALREIENLACEAGPRTHVVHAIDLVRPAGEDEAMAVLDRFKTSAPSGSTEVAGKQWYGGLAFRQQSTVHRFQQRPEQLAEWYRLHIERYYRLVMPFYVARLDGRTRFELSDEKPASDLQRHPENHLQALFLDDVARASVREATEAAFGLSFVIDPTAMGRFRIRLSSRPPVSAKEERALTNEACAFHEAAVPISDMGDGVRSFAGLLAAVASFPHRVLLIDEPEAFLHPPLARRLGGLLARQSHDRSSSVVAATHSADFLMGVLGADQTASIVRLTYNRGAATARTLGREDLRQLMRDPLLRSAGALRGVFHHSVVVGESETDRAFYDEVNQRLLAEDRGVVDGLFLSAQNWQTTGRIAGPLRKLGIPAAVVLDFDSLRESGRPWSRLLEMCGLPEGEARDLRNSKRSVTAALRTLDQNDIKSRGLVAVSPEQREECENLIGQLKDLGIFIVSGGEVESWLAPLNCTGKKVTWLVNMFEVLGSDSTAPTYVRPADDDVWVFLDEIAAWASDPNRRGLP